MIRSASASSTVSGLIIDGYGTPMATTRPSLNAELCRVLEALDGDRPCPDDEVHQDDGVDEDGHCRCVLAWASDDEAGWSYLPNDPDDPTAPC